MSGVSDLFGRLACTSSAILLDSVEGHTDPTLSQLTSRVIRNLLTGKAGLKTTWYGEACNMCAPAEKGDRYQWQVLYPPNEEGRGTSDEVQEIVDKGAELGCGRLSDSSLMLACAGRRARDHKRIVEELGTRLSNPTESEDQLRLFQCALVYSSSSFYNSEADSHAWLMIPVPGKGCYILDSSKGRYSISEQWHTRGKAPLSEGQLKKFLASLVNLGCFGMFSKANRDKLPGIDLPFKTLIAMEAKPREKGTTYQFELPYFTFAEHAFSLSEAEGRLTKAFERFMPTAESRVAELLYEIAWEGRTTQPPSEGSLPLTALKEALHSYDWKENSPQELAEAAIKHLGPRAHLLKALSWVYADDLRTAQLVGAVCASVTPRLHKLLSEMATCGLSTYLRKQYGAFGWSQDTTRGLYQIIAGKKDEWYASDRQVKSSRQLVTDRDMTLYTWPLLRLSWSDPLPGEEAADQLIEKLGRLGTPLQLLDLVAKQRGEDHREIVAELGRSLRAPLEPGQVRIFECCFSSTGTETSRQLGRNWVMLQGPDGGCYVIEPKDGAGLPKQWILRGQHPLDEDELEEFLQGLFEVGDLSTEKTVTRNLPRFGRPLTGERELHTSHHVHPKEVELRVPIFNFVEGTSTLSEAVGRWEEAVRSLQLTPEGRIGELLYDLFSGINLARFGRRSLQLRALRSELAKREWSEKAQQRLAEAVEEHLGNRAMKLEKSLEGIDAPRVVKLRQKVRALAMAWPFDDA